MIPSSFIQTILLEFFGVTVHVLITSVIFSAVVSAGFLGVNVMLVSDFASIPALLVSVVPAFLIAFLFFFIF